MWLCKQAVSVPSFSVTVTTGTKDMAGTHLKASVETVPIEVRPRPRTEPEPAAIPEPVLPTEPVQTAENVQPSAGGFLGTVYIPKPRPKTSARNHARPLSGVTVTIMSGLYSGKSVITNQSGQYLFQGVGVDELHLLVKKSGFEPKEVIVHRSNPTTLPDRVPLNFPDDSQNEPGKILMGHVWPAPIRKILQSIATVPDLLYTDEPSFERLGFYDNRLGNYDNGVSTIKSTLDRDLYLAIHAHEIAHAHQDVVSGGPKAGNLRDRWAASSEAKAFAEARRKDLEEVGKTPYDHVSYFNDLLSENAAETCAIYWGFDRWDVNLKISAPHRFKWAQKWLR